MTGSETRQAAALRVGGVFLLFLALKALGNLSLAWGMKHFPQAMSANPLPFLKALFDPFVAVGILAFILALLLRMALLSLADLSYVLPVTAIGYFIAALLGKVFLNETVSNQRWLGTVFIFIGAALVGTTAHSTTEAAPAPVRRMTAGQGAGDGPGVPPYGGAAR
jgi:drug/metabolite transporter (DMT)-like permease